MARGLAGLLTLVSLVGAQEAHEYRQVVMGTEARLVIHADSEQRAVRAAKEAYQRLDALDAALSDYRADSELAAVVAGAGGAPVPVGPDLFDVLRRARAQAERTGGAFDPTVAPVVALWRQARDTGALPDEQALAAAADLVSWQDLELDAQASTARLARAGMALDLGGCAKGFAAQQALAILTAHGCPSSLVDLGGDLALGDPPPGREAWRVSAGCALPGRAPRVLELANTCVATSGSTEQHLELDGVVLSHVVDPRTGQALADAPCVTVVGSDGLTADLLASALMVLGPADGRRLASESWTVSRVLLDDPGAVPLFDGVSLDGWVDQGGRYDGRARWSLEDGCIVGRTAEDGAGGLLYTEGEYTDFELELEVRLTHPYDSGVFVRMVPRPGGRGGQVTLDDRPGGEIGGIYSDGWLAHQPLGTLVWRKDQWNHVRVLCEGADQHTMAWINGQLVVDHRLPAGAEGFAPSGRIGIQVHGGGAQQGHGGEARFRELTVRELP
jgi:thiamine biosynthesis lipoprotein